MKFNKYFKRIFFLQFEVTEKVDNGNKEDTLYRKFQKIFGKLQHNESMNKVRD